MKYKDKAPLCSYLSMNQCSSAWTSTHKNSVMFWCLVLGIFTQSCHLVYQTAKSLTTSKTVVTVCTNSEPNGPNGVALPRARLLLELLRLNRSALCLTALYWQSKSKWARLGHTPGMGICLQSLLKLTVASADLVNGKGKSWRKCQGWGASFTDD